MTPFLSISIVALVDARKELVGESVSGEKSMRYAW